MMAIIFKSRIIYGGLEGLERFVFYVNFALDLDVLATAFREMEQLVALGILKQNPGRGRSASYDLNWP
jgi:hypothetical protein